MLSPPGGRDAATKISLMPDDAGKTIREYRESDASAVRDCIVELQEFERRIDDRLRPGESIAVEYLGHLLRRCRDCNGTIFVSECDEAVAGFISVLARVAFEGLDDPPGHYALVTDLVVREGLRRRGIGEALLLEAERYARAAGATELRIGVLSANHAARSLYRLAGFEPHLETLAKRLDRPSGGR